MPERRLFPPPRLKPPEVDLFEVSPVSGTETIVRSPPMSAVTVWPATKAPASVVSLPDWMTMSPVPVT
ncbi:hypothetical protein D3C87_2065580 [compost metagenome]